MTVPNFMCESTGTPGSLASLDTLIFHWLFNGGDKTCWTIVSNSLSLMLPLMYSFCFHQEMGRCLCRSRICDLDSLFMSLNIPSPQEDSRCDMIVLSIWMTVMFSHLPCISQTHGKLWAMHLARSIFVNTQQLLKQSKPMPPPLKVAFFCGIMTSENSVGMCMRAFVRHSDSFILVFTQINPKAYCLNTVTLKICLEKDQTKSKAPVF